MTSKYVEVASEVASVLKDHAAEVDRSGEFPTTSLEAIRSAGLMGLLVPAEHGGGAGTLKDLVEVAQVLASGCLSTALIWAMHCQQVDVLTRYGRPELLARVLPGIAEHGHYLASVTTEAGGGRLLDGKSPLAWDNGRLAFERIAPVVTGGAHADGFLITFREAADGPANRMTLIYASREDVTLSSKGSWDTLGMRATESVGLTIAGSVSEEGILGEPGAFRDIAVESLAAVGHLAWAACWLGAARGGLSDLLRLYRDPRHPAKIDTSSDLTAERLARVRIDLDVVGGFLTSVVTRVLERRTTGQTLGDTVTQLHLNNLKVVAAEHTFQAASRLVQVAGLDLGYKRDSPVALERLLRDLRSASLNYADDRLLAVTGRLVLLDLSVTTP